MISFSDVRKSFGGRPVLNSVSFNVRQGEMLGIIGPNGGGKSTLLRIMSGVDAPTAGEAYLEGKPVERYSRKELARFLAVLQQDALPPVGFTVREVIEMGRYPFQNWLGDDERDAADSIDRIIEQLGLNALSDRTLEHLSGGERQRVALGKAMAQEPKLLLLDEPTTYLDIGYQVQMMDYIRGWQKETELTVIAVLHDLNVAAQYCDRLLVLHDGGVAALGAPGDVLDAPLITRVYGTEPLIVPHPVSGVPQILLQSRLMA
ncbi:ABC transporter ATP-binding protein [Paenibacillus contaminans]|uniref:ABC transporter ATP-binding protein n=1 Tax=Paenibacillus contaminans TaxID=450362 RepID=A0A329LYN3_9BACL|nr:ABC transporter ATP-binding protein [Paenibacillus contaminans]RAV12949.1 ABC transporter ATP-binding protein [Paenibacillus contaminans]